MNKIIISLIVILLAMTFSSCQDSLGIDPNVQKNPIVGNPGDDDSTGDDSPVYEITKKSMNFLELILFQGNVYQNFEWFDNVDFDKFSCKIDTTQRDYYLWIDIDAECTYPDAVITNRNDRVTGVQVRLDSLKLPGNATYISRHGINNNLGLKFKLYVKDLNTKRSTYYNEKDIVHDIGLEIDRNRRIIIVNMSFWLISLQHESIHYDTGLLETVMYLHYGE